MADVSISLFDLEEKEIEIDELILYELCSDLDAACDALKISFLYKKALPEIYRVEASVNGKRVFFGYADTQRENECSNGFVCFIYARSSACLLTDIEAKPFTYYSPSAASIWKRNADDLGFEYKLGDIYCEDEYQISKGTSVFGAIQGFVLYAAGESIRITPQNCVEIMKSKNSVEIKGDILELKRVINRANALSKITYKLNSDKDYIYTRESEFIKSRKITSGVMKNLSSVEDWQRDRVLESIMLSANSEYYTYEITVAGFECVELMDEIKVKSRMFGLIKGFAFSIMHIMDENGERTRLKIRVSFDLEERTNVVE